MRKKPTKTFDEKRAAEESQQGGTKPATQLPIELRSSGRGASMRAGLFVGLGIDQAESVAIGTANIDVPVGDDRDRDHRQLV